MREGLPRERRSIPDGEMDRLRQGAEPFCGNYSPEQRADRTDRDAARGPRQARSRHWRSEDDHGLQLGQLREGLLGHVPAVVERVVDGSGDAAVNGRGIAAGLAAEDDSMVARYARGSLGQDGGSYIPPLGA